MVLVYIVVIVIAIFQLILLMKIWNMTNDISKMKEKVFAFMSRSSSVERRIDIVKVNMLSKLKQEYFISKETNWSQLPIKINEAFDKEGENIREMLADYDLEDNYNIDSLKLDVQDIIKKM